MHPFRNNLCNSRNHLGHFPILCALNTNGPWVIWVVEDENQPKRQKKYTLIVTQTEHRHLLGSIDGSVKDENSTRRLHLIQ